MRIVQRVKINRDDDHDDDDHNHHQTEYFCVSVSFVRVRVSAPCYLRRILSNRVSVLIHGHFLHYRALACKSLVTMKVQIKYIGYIHVHILC